MEFNITMTNCQGFYTIMFGDWDGGSILLDYEFRELLHKTLNQYFNEIKNLANNSFLFIEYDPYYNQHIILSNSKDDMQNIANYLNDKYRIILNLIT